MGPRGHIRPVEVAWRAHSSMPADGERREAHLADAAVGGAEMRPGCRKRSALWKVGNRSFQAEHALSTWERAITWTDEEMVVGQEREAGDPLQKPRLIRAQTR